MWVHTRTLTCAHMRASMPQKHWQVCMQMRLRFGPLARCGNDSKYCIDFELLLTRSGKVKILQIAFCPIPLSFSAGCWMLLGWSHSNHIQACCLLCAARPLACPRHPNLFRKLRALWHARASWLLVVTKNTKMVACIWSDNESSGCTTLFAWCICMLHMARQYSCWLAVGMRHAESGTKQSVLGKSKQIQWTSVNSEYVRNVAA